MKKIPLLVLLAAAVIFAGDSCKKKTDEEQNPDDNEILLPSEYEGTLYLLFTNTFPQFESSTTLPVEVNEYGHMVFGIGELQYSGEGVNGEVKMRRAGELILAPNGEAFKDEGKIYFAVDENTTVEETFTVWVWDGSQWMQTVNETVTNTWNDGLNFDLENAELEGSVVEVVNANGTVKWKLTLIPKLVGSY